MLSFYIYIFNYMIQRKHSAQADLNLRLPHMSKDEDTFSDIGLQSAIPIQIAGLTTVLQTVMNYIRKKSHAQLNNGCNENSKSIINPMGVILTLIESRKFCSRRHFIFWNYFSEKMYLVFYVWIVRWTRVTTFVTTGLLSCTPSSN